MLTPPLLPWGDFGQLLLAGTAERSPATGLLQLDRAGPFVPPITITSQQAIVVTTAFRAALEASGLSGVAFRPVIKRHIVQLAWEHWDRAALAPAVYPVSGEPEGYLTEHPHAPELAARMGELWELVLTAHAHSIRAPASPGTVPRALRAIYPDKGAAELASLIPFFPETYLVQASWDGTDWFRAVGAAEPYVSARAQAWLEQAAPTWVTCQRAPLR